MTQPNDCPRLDRRQWAADLDDVLARLMRRWTRDGIDLLPPATPREIHAVFRQLGSIATPDVVTLYTTFGGMEDMDDDLLQIQPLADIARQTPSPRGVVFADYLISSWEYRLVPSAGPCSAVISSSLDHHTGPTLEAFLLSVDAEKGFVERYY